MKNCRHASTSGDDLMDLVLGMGDSRILSSCSTWARPVDRQDPQGKLAAPSSHIVCLLFKLLLVIHVQICFSSRLFDAFRSARDFVPFIYLFKHMCLIYLLRDTTNATTKSEENAKIYFYNIIFCPWVCYQLGDQFICVCTPSYYQFNGLKKASTY